MCPHHPDKVQSITYGNLLKGRGCRYCGITRRGLKRRLKFEDVKQAFDERGYELLSTEYITAQEKLLYRCPNHPEHIQEITWNNFSKGEGCAYCANEKRGEKRRHPLSLLKEEFKQRGLILVTTERNHYYENLQYMCSKHMDAGVMEISLGNFHHGKGCPICNTSKGEKAIKEYLEQHKISFKSQHTFEGCKYANKLLFDFYLPDYNIAIEYDGEQHYKPVCFGGVSKDVALKNFELVQIRDSIKTEYCEDNNIQLLRIAYTDFDRIGEILDNTLFTY